MTYCNSPLNNHYNLHIKIRVNVIYKPKTWNLEQVSFTNIYKQQWPTTVSLWFLTVLKTASPPGWGLLLLNLLLLCLLTFLKEGPPCGLTLGLLLAILVASIAQSNTTMQVSPKAPSLIWNCSAPECSSASRRAPHGLLWNHRSAGGLRKPWEWNAQKFYVKCYMCVFWR